MLYFQGEPGEVTPPGDSSLKSVNESHHRGD